MLAREKIDSHPVILHIYSISERVNRFSLMLGLGLYHTGVEIYGQEHSFVGHPFKFSGIVAGVPKRAPYIYQEGLEMGRTTMNEQSVGMCLRELGKIFTGLSYHLLNNNCNHFASEFVKRLCNGQPPAYINRAANSACCLPFLDTMFSAKIDSERFFVEVLYLTLNGEMDSVMDLLQVDPLVNLARYVSYIEAAFDDHSIPKCLPYFPIIKTFNPFALSHSALDLIRKNLCANLIFTQSKIIYDQAFDLSEQLKGHSANLSDYPSMNISDPILDPNVVSSADYSADIHRYLNRVHHTLMEIVSQSSRSDTVEFEKNDF